MDQKAIMGVRERVCFGGGVTGSETVRRGGWTGPIQSYPIWRKGGLGPVVGREHICVLDLL